MVPWKGRKHKPETILKMRQIHSGVNSASWKGGRRKHSEGYVEIKNPEHPNCNNSGYVFEHRLVMEKHLGRYLDPKEVVHHKNGNRADNRIENLELKLNHSIHLSEHMKKDMSDRLCFRCASDQTRFNKISGYLNWYRHPLTKEEWLCAKCYDTTRRRLGLKKLYPAKLSLEPLGILR